MHSALASNSNFTATLMILTAIMPPTAGVILKPKLVQDPSYMNKIVIKYSFLKKLKIKIN